MNQYYQSTEQANPSCVEGTLSCVVFLFRMIKFKNAYEISNRFQKRISKTVQRLLVHFKTSIGNIKEQMLHSYAS